MSKSAMETLNNDFSQLEPFIRRAIIHDLPNEILEHIFCFLSIKERIRTKLVCRRWRDIGTNGLWKYPTKLDFADVTKLELERIPITDDVVLAILSRCGRSVRQLQVPTTVYLYDGCQIHLTIEVLNIITDNCPNLTEVRLHRLSAEDTLSSALLNLEDYLINLAQRCPKLKKVFVGYSPGLNNDILGSFLKHCHSLEYLHLDGNVLLTGDFIDSLKTDLKGFVFSHTLRNIENVFEKLVKRCGHIEELCVTTWPLQDIPLPVLKMVLCYYNDTLKNLSLARYLMKPSEWYCIPEVIPQLEVLSLATAIEVDDHLIKILAEKCKKLKSLDLSSTPVTDVGVAALALVPSLTELNLRYTKVTGKGIEILATKGRLEKFAFSMSGPGSKLEESCISLAKCCPNLRVLILSGENVTDRLVEEINSSLETGFMKGPVCVYVLWTKVTRQIKCCQKLRLFFSYAECDVFSSERSFMK